jgi:RNA polymerase sigma-70 factor (ECF subfamily)
MVAAQAGDAAAYEALLRACVPRIASTVRRQGLRGAAVDDAVQDTLLAVHRARATYDPARPFGPWLAAIARRRAIDVIRQLGRRHAREAHDPVAYEGFADVVSDPTMRLDADENASRVRAAVAALPPRQREAVQRLALAEESLDQASRDTGRSKVALKVNLHRALKALRVRLSGSGDPHD